MAHMPIHTALDGHVFTVTIDRPEARNALDARHFGALANAWRTFRDDPDAWVAVITGVGDSFCVGADLKTFVPAVTEKVEDLVAARASGDTEAMALEDDIPADAGLVAVLRNFDLFKPVIAAVNGICTAGGMEMLLGTDIRIAAESATFGIAEPRRGLFPGGGTTVRLPRQVPYARAMEILLVCDQISAAQAEALGLVNRVVPGDCLLDEAYDWAARICRNAPLAIRAVKESVMEGLRRPLSEAFDFELMKAAEVFMSNDAKEGPRAFKEKRDPVWTGT
jgi:enoyl-CoA hydratase